MTRIFSQLILLLLFVGGIFLCLETSLSLLAAETAKDESNTSEPAMTEEEIKSLCNVIGQNTKSLPEDLGKTKVTQADMDSFLSAYNAVEKILKQDLTEDARIWTLKRKGVAMIVLAYGDTQKYFPALSAFVDELDAQKGCEKITQLVESHVLRIASFLAFNKIDGKTIPVDLEALAERVLFFAEKYPSSESDMLIDMLIISAQQLPLQERDRRLAILAPLFAEYYQKTNRHAKSQNLQTIARRVTLPGKEMKVFGVGVDGQIFDAESIKGKVVLVEFWGTWCIPCQEKIPSLIKLYDKHKSKGFEIIGVNTGNKEDKQIGLVNKFLSETTFDGNKKITWPIVYDGPINEPERVTLTNYYGITELPQMMLIGRDGKVISINPSIHELDAAIREALLETVEN
ncbi:MAG: TlpA disulfide reductase family protein [Thermoguttaceae bacterium]